MNKSYEFLLQDISKLKKIGKKTALILKKKNINNIFDILWRLPRSFTDRSNISKIKDLHIGKISTVEIIPLKYNFPRIRNLPNKVICEDDTGKLDCIFFNSYEGYIRKILPLNEKITISGKINYYKKKYQITNPTYLSKDKSVIKKIHNKYNLTEGITEKKYNFIINQIIEKLPDLKEWLSPRIANLFNNIRWKESIVKLHDYNNIGKHNTKFFKRLVFDEILSSFIVFSEIRKSIKKIKKNKKIFSNKYSNETINNFGFNLTKDQINTLKEINVDLSSKSKMFRILQGDVGSGKTIVALLSSLNVIESGYQVAFMSPTEILANQHYNLAKKIFPNEINIDLLTGKTESVSKKIIISNLKNSSTKMVFGTHSLFQKKTLFKKLGYIIIDEQHKFGVKQRKSLSDKGGSNCDILLMSATPIPRTLTMTIYGDMDLSVINEKPKNRKEIITYSKREDNIKDILTFVKKEIDKGNQIFWVCPLIDDSKKIDHQSAIKKFNSLNKLFHSRVAIIHSKIDNDKKNIILKGFLNKKFDILVSTTIIEVGIDFPNANVIIIENSNKFGLSQLHQLRGRVGRGVNQGKCILMFKNNLSENAKKRIKILKNTNNGFVISNEDMKLRGFGDVLGFKQSGDKKFNLADPIIHEDLFKIAEKEIRRIEIEETNLSKYKTLIKLYDKADIIYDLV
jgi:ATP-dependent DNA helicase RecG|tara:strand:+ start:344 stop:2389 length:2046 start_codon:yes stop_codon:yes gene_type:complete